MLYCQNVGDVHPCLQKSVTTSCYHYSVLILFQNSYTFYPFYIGILLFAKIIICHPMLEYFFHMINLPPYFEFNISISRTLHQKSLLHLATHSISGGCQLIINHHLKTAIHSKLNLHSKYKCSKFSLTCPDKQHSPSFVMPTLSNLCFFYQPFVKIEPGIEVMLWCTNFVPCLNVPPTFPPCFQKPFIGMRCLVLQCTTLPIPR